VQRCNLLAKRPICKLLLATLSQCPLSVCASDKNHGVCGDSCKGERSPQAVKADEDDDPYDFCKQVGNVLDRLDVTLESWPMDVPRPDRRVPYHIGLPFLLYCIILVYFYDLHMRLRDRHGTDGTLRAICNACTLQRHQKNLYRGCA